ncbi:hypothetical protein [Sulfurimonas sp.]|uniref:hypothetical protein n=1 Tax=Sulfurimonas sp. TaxID=2022749 RepID=UPI0025EE062E|nr:hypothetical protein [Sulfurimonas sp.]MBW6487467.1 hypothetical protein [Sulfurimonas sp.]
MAKKKTPKDLLEEAKNIMVEARKKQAVLMQQAKDLEEKKFAELGKKCIEFLEDKCTKESLEYSAKKIGLLEESERESENKSEDRMTTNV